MAKLYPPYIEGSIPAFFGKKLIVPYEMNKTVGYNDITGFKLKIMTVTTNKIIGYVNSINNDFTTNEVVFYMPVDEMLVGQFYKIQLAYISGYDYKLSNNITEEIFKNNIYYVFENGEYKIANEFSNEEEYYIQEENIGFYSNIGVVKYTGVPFIEIAGLSAGKINLHSYNYVGKYQPNEKDITEKEIAYQFDVYSTDSNLYLTSGKKVHNDLEEDKFDFSDTLNQKDIYYLQYTIWTINGLKFSSPKYRIAERESLEVEFDFDLTVERNYDDAYFDLYLEAENSIVASGSFVIVKSSEEDNYKTWNEIYNFEYKNQYIKKNFLFRDFILKQGVKYKYAIRQFNSAGLYSQPEVGKMGKSEECYADFEDMFLFDGERQLKLRFNGKMSSYKTSMLEQKVNSIGSKYPFIFRNGNVAYKEFPLNGLISYHMDENNLFMIGDNEKPHRHSTPVSFAEFNKNYYRSTDLTSENYTKERIFKNEVLDWLNNGKPKILKSPSEGNFIIKLLNVSLTPEDRVSRMIHNFSATAYEIAELNYKNSLYYNFIVLPNKERYIMKWETIPLYSAGKFFNGKINEGKPALTVEFNNMRPKDTIIIDGEEIQVGATGDLELNYDTPINEIVIPEGSQYFGFVTFSYYDTTVNNFKEIKDIHLEEISLKQIKGEELFEGLAEEEKTFKNAKCLADCIEDVRTKILNIYLLRFYLKNPYLSLEEENNILMIGNSKYDLSDIKYYEIEDPENFDFENLTIKFGSNIICEYSCQVKITTFNIEDRSEIKTLKTKWKKSITDFLANLKNYNNIFKENYSKLKELKLNKLKAPGYINKYTKDKEECDGILKDYLSNGETLVDNWVLHENDNYALTEKSDNLPLTLEEAIDYVQTIGNSSKQSLVRENIFKEIQKNKQLTNNSEDFEKNLWGDLEEIFNLVKVKYPESESNITTVDGTNSLSFIMVIPGEDDGDPVGENYPKAIYSDTDPGEFMEGSLWVNEEDDKVYPIYDYTAPPGNNDDNNYNSDSIETNDNIYIDVYAFIDDVDPDTLNLNYDLWFEEKKEGTNSDTLNKDLFLFRYNNHNYLDLIYVNNENKVLNEEDPILLSAVALYDGNCTTRNDYSKLNEPDFIFKIEKYIIGLDKNYWLYRKTSYDELNTRIKDLEAISENRITVLQELELILLEKSIEQPDENGLYDFYVPVTHRDIYGGAISLYCNSTESLYEKYGKNKENFNFQPAYKIDDLNKYFYYKTVDIDKIKTLLEENKKLQEQIDYWIGIQNDNESENIYRQNIENAYELINEDAQQTIQNNYNEYVKKLTQAIEGVSDI